MSQFAILDDICNVIENPQLSINKDFLTQQKIPTDTIEKIMRINGHVQNLAHFQTEDQKEIKTLMDKSRQDTFAVIEDLKKTLQDTLKESRGAQDISKTMYIITFLLGLVLIGFAIYFGIQGKQILAIAFGSFGMLDIIAHLVANPPAQIQESRSNYAQLSVAMLAWFGDMINNSSMTVQAANGKSVKENLENFTRLSELQMENTIKMLRLIDDVAEPSEFNKNKEVKKMDIVVE